MPFTDLQVQILDRQLCARCGGCAAVCPRDVLEMGDEGLPRLLVDEPAIPATCADCRLCLDVCPGLDTAAAETELRMFGRTRSVEERWTGIVREVNAVVCPEPAIRRRAAAGGAGTALLLAALRAGFVDSVIVIGRDRERPWIPRAVLTSDEDVVVSCSQSTYCVAPNLQLLREAEGERVGLVGLPCEIQAVGRMKNLDKPPSVADRIALTLEIACSSNTLIGGTEHLITGLLRLDTRDVAEVRYRDGEYPGEFAVWTRDGRRHGLPFFRLVEEFKAFKTHRCKSCPDWWSGLADVSICDGDPNIFASSRDGHGAPECSLVVTRTEAGRRLLAAARELGLLRVSPATFEPEVSLGLQRKRNRYADMRRNSSRIVPWPPVPGADDIDYEHDDAVIERLSSPASRADGTAEVTP